MSTKLPALPESNAVPAYLRAAVAADPRLAQTVIDAAAGIGGGMVPTIALKGTRFVFKESGKDDVLHTSLELPVVVLDAKAPLEKKFYLTKYNEGQEAQAPDCFSLDGIKPDPSSRAKQCDNCASCPQNVFGSGTNAQGEPGKGKACADTKVIAVYVNKKGIFRFPIPPASLGAFATYCKQLGARGIPLQGVFTVLGFDATASYPKLTFNFGGMVPEAAFPKLLAMVDSEEVKAIVENGHVPALPAPPAGGTTQVEHKVEDAAAKKEAAAEKKAAAAKAKAEKEAAEKAAAEPAAANVSLDLGMDDGADTGADVALGASEDAVIDALGLDID